MLSVKSLIARERWIPCPSSSAISLLGPSKNSTAERYAHVAISEGYNTFSAILGGGFSFFTLPYLCESICSINNIFLFFFKCTRGTLATHLSFPIAETWRCVRVCIHLREDSVSHYRGQDLSTSKGTAPFPHVLGENIGRL